MNQQKSKNISFKSLFTESFSIFKNYLYEILFLTSIPFLAITLLYLYTGDGSIEAIINMPPQIVSIIYTLFFISFLIIFPILMRIVQGSKAGEPITIKGALFFVRRKLIKLFFALLLVFGILILLTGIMLLVANLAMNSMVLSTLFAIVFSLLCIKLLIDFLFYKQSLILNDMSPIKALKHSLVLTKKSWWKVFNVYFLFNLCILLIMNLIALFIAFVLPVPVVSNIAIAFVQSLSVMFTQIFLTVLFLQLDELN